MLDVVTTHLQRQEVKVNWF